MVQLMSMAEALQMPQTSAGHLVALVLVYAPLLRGVVLLTYSLWAGSLQRNGASCDI